MKMKLLAAVVVFMAVVGAGCATAHVTPPQPQHGPPPATETQGPRGVQMPRSTISDGITSLLAPALLNEAEANTKTVMATANVAPSDRQHPQPTTAAQASARLAGVHIGPVTTQAMQGVVVLAPKALQLTSSALLAATVTPPIFLETADPVDPTVPAICGTDPLTLANPGWPASTGSGKTAMSLVFGPASTSLTRLMYGIDSQDGKWTLVARDARGCAAVIRKP